MAINWLIDEPLTRYRAFDPVFRSNALLISITGSYPIDRVKAGNLNIGIEIEGQPFIYASKLLKFGNNLVPVGISNYLLFFNPNVYIDARFNPIIKIAEYNINMQVTPASNSLPQVGEDIFYTVNPVPATDPTPVFLLVAARSRKAARITNKTTAGMYLKGGAAATLPTLLAGDPFTFVPAGGSYTFEDYSGDIVGIMSGSFAVGGKIIVAESPYILESMPTPPLSGG